jgi:hypothetical protein
MKIISLIHRTRPTRTNKEQNAGQRKLYFASRGLGRSARDGEMAVFSLAVAKYCATGPGEKPAARQPARRAQREKNLKRWLEICPEL